MYIGTGHAEGEAGLFETVARYSRGDQHQFDRLIGFEL
jgi:hypothetical protein